MSDELMNEEVVEPSKPKKPEDFYGTFDTSIVYDYKKAPDIVTGRCDNCGNAHFSMSIKDTILSRKCSNCGMTKSI